MLKPNLITQYLGMCVILQTSCPGAEEGSGIPLLMLKPQQYKILPQCGFTILLSALKAVFSKGFSFKIYVCEERAAESRAQVLHLFCLAAVSAQGVERQVAALGRRSIDICKSYSNERWWKKNIKNMRQLSEVGVNTIVVLGGVRMCVSPVCSDGFRGPWTYRSNM